jgi:hypothetical protein
LGGRKFEAGPWDPDAGNANRRAPAFDNAFPKFGRARASAKVINQEFTDSDGDERQHYCVEVTIPRRCRIAALLEDIDYTAPVWLNLAAILSFVWTITPIRLSNDPLPSRGSP